MKALANVASFIEGGGDGCIGGQLTLPVSVADQALSLACLVTSLAAIAFDPFSICSKDVHT